MRILFLLIFLTLSLLANVGVVGAFNGDAKLLRDNSSLDIFSGMKLQEHDAIITQKETKVQLVMKDETVITIGPSSHFEIDSYRFDPKLKSHLSLRIKRGFFRTITGKIGKLAPERFKIRTKSATIGIRGTDFAAYVDTKNEYIGCFNGEIQVSTANKTFDIEAKTMVALISGQWEKHILDVQKFHPILLRNQPTIGSKNSIKKPFKDSDIEAMTQQERLQNASFKIEPGYTLETSPPPFVP